MLLTVVLAAVFTALQYFEYEVARFSLSNGAYGCCFPVSTGLHGLQVLAFTLLLTLLWYDWRHTTSLKSTTFVWSRRSPTGSRRRGLARALTPCVLVG